MKSKAITKSQATEKDVTCAEIEGLVNEMGISYSFSFFCSFLTLNSLPGLSDLLFSLVDCVVMERNAYQRQVCVSLVPFRSSPVTSVKPSARSSFKEQTGERLLVRMVGNGCTVYSQYILPYMEFALIAPVRVFGNVPSS